LGGRRGHQQNPRQCRGEGTSRITGADCAPPSAARPEPGLAARCGASREADSWKAMLGMGRGERVPFPGVAWSASASLRSRTPTKTSTGTAGVRGSRPRAGLAWPIRLRTAIRASCTPEHAGRRTQTKGEKKGRMQKVKHELFASAPSAGSWFSALAMLCFDGRGGAERIRGVRYERTGCV